MQYNTQTLGIISYDTLHITITHYAFTIM